MAIQVCSNLEHDENRATKDKHNAQHDETQRDRSPEGQRSRQVIFEKFAEKHAVA